MEKDKYYETIKGEILNNEITRKVKDYSKNRSDLKTYASIGKTLEEAGKHYGKNIIKEYSERLTNELNKNYSVRTLYNMRDYYRKIYCNVKLQPVAAILGWSHYCELFKITDDTEMFYYIMLAHHENLSKRELRTRIKNKEYERLDEETKEKLMSNDKQEITDYIKNPIIIQNKNRYEEISEKVLQKIILEDIPSFLEELGDGFTFIIDTIILIYFYLILNITAM